MPPYSIVDNSKSRKFRQQKKHETGFEPATLALARRYSTTEPLVHTIFVKSKDIIARSAPMCQGLFAPFSLKKCSFFFEESRPDLPARSAFLGIILPLPMRIQMRPGTLLQWFPALPLYGMLLRSSSTFRCPYLLYGQQ